MLVHEPQRLRGLRGAGVLVRRRVLYLAVVVVGAGTVVPPVLAQYDEAVARVTDRVLVLPARPLRPVTGRATRALRRVLPRLSVAQSLFACRFPYRLNEFFLFKSFLNHYADHL